MKGALGSACAGLLALAAAAVLPAPRAPDAAAREPLARALAPLGPVKALVSAGLWVAVVQQQVQGDGDGAVPLARALVELHPGADGVREFLAGQLIASEATRATDRAAHEALVGAGLTLFVEGFARGASPRLRSALGRVLGLQREADPRFEAVAARVLGEPPRELAIELLRDSPEPEFDGRLRAELLLERALDAARHAGDPVAARADLRRAREALRAARVAADEIEERLAPLNALLDAPDARGARPEGGP